MHGKIRRKVRHIRLLVRLFDRVRKTLVSHIHFLVPKNGIRKTLFMHIRLLVPLHGKASERASKSLVMHICLLVPLRGMASDRSRRKTLVRLFRLLVPLLGNCSIFRARRT